MGRKTKNPQERTIFTTHEVAAVLQVNFTTVIDWVDKDFLKAYKTPGGHRRIRRADLLAFLETHKMPVPMELVRPHGTRVLIVDDELDVRKFLQRAIKAAGFLCAVETAEDGFEAGKKVLAFLPDLVVLDLNLPGIDGFKVCHNIKSDLATKHIKVLVITGLAGHDIKEKALKAGADGFMTKPVGIAKFQEETARLLNLELPASVRS